MGAAFLCFPGTAGRKKPLLCFISCDSSSFPVQNPQMLLLGASPSLRDVPLCAAGGASVQGGSPRGSHLPRAGARCVQREKTSRDEGDDSKDAIAGDLTCSWTRFSPQLRPVPLHPCQAVLHHPSVQIYRTVTMKINPHKKTLHSKKPLHIKKKPHTEFMVHMVLLHTIPQAFHPTFQPTAAISIVRLLPEMHFAVAQRASWDSRRWKEISSQKDQVSTPQSSVKECQSCR